MVQVNPTLAACELHASLQYYKVNSNQNNFTVAGVDPMPKPTANAAVGKKRRIELLSTLNFLGTFATADGTVLLVCGGIVVVSGELTVSR